MLAGSGQGPVEPAGVELRIRELALDPLAHADALVAALSSERWSERARALEALSRRAELGAPPALERGLLVPHLGDPHPNVRALALEVLAHASQDGEGLPAEALLAMSDGLPVERLSVCRSLAMAEARFPDDRLLALAFDADERVRDAARATLAGERPGGAAWPKAALLARLAAGPEAELARFFRRLERAHLAAAELEELSALDGEARTCGLVETLRFVNTEDGDPEVWLAGYRAALEEPETRRLFLLAARSEHEGLARTWIGLLARSEAGVGRDPGARRSRGELREALLASAPPEGIGRLAADAGVPATLWEELLPELGGRLERFDGHWLRDLLAPVAAPEVRRAAALLLVRAVGRERPSWVHAAERLRRLLRDSDAVVAATAFRGLARSPDPRAFADELRATWRGLSTEERRRRLPWLPRDVPLEPLLDDWLRLGELRGERRVACELLRPFLAHDALEPAVRSRIAEALERWIDEALAGLGDEPPPRALELELQALVRTAGERPAAFLAVLDRALERAAGHSKEVTKAVLAAFAHTPAGVERLRAVLAGTVAFPVDERTRVEAALQLADLEPGTEGVLAVLAAGYERADGELRRRMIRAAGACGDAGAADFLGGFVFSLRASSEERALALNTLAELPDSARLELLERAVNDAGDVEARLLAARSLGRAGEAAAVPHVLAALEAVAVQPRLGEEERALLRSELLVSLGRGGHFPPELEPLVLAAPLDEAPRDLAARFRGERLAECEFSWRTELFLAEALAREGRYAGVLDRAPGWVGLDGRLLIALGERVLHGGEPSTARRLLEAGLVGMMGDAEPDHEARFRARSRLLGLAWRQERFDEVERLAASLLLEYRAGSLPTAPFARAFGVFDPGAGVDPRGRLESAVWQARARRALGAGDRGRASALAAEARRRIGSSELALKEQERLEADL